MDKQLIERLARKAGCDILGADGFADDHWLHRFAALIAEECAKISEQCGMALQVLGHCGPEESVWHEIAAEDMRVEFGAHANDKAHISELGLSGRVTRVLLHAGVETIGQVRNVDLHRASFPGYGRKAAVEVRKALARLDARKAGVAITVPPARS